MTAATRPNPIRQAARSAMGAVLPRRMIFIRGPRDQARVGLTFDDGPHPEFTPAVLDALAANRALATFFVVGQQAERHPGIVRRMVDEGHAIGGHSYTHGEPNATSAPQLLAEIRRTNDLLADITGRPPQLFRPPHGKLTLAKCLAAWRLRQTIVLWSVDPKDYAQPSAESLRSSLRAKPPLSGDIVLLHDNRPFAAEIIADLMDSIRANGLAAGTVSDWLRSSPSEYPAS